MSGIHLRHWPGDDTRPALALHCMLGSASYWGPIADALDGRIDLRSFDMPGHGLSPFWQAGPDDLDFHTAVTRIAASFIDRPLDLIGHSMGATVALRIAVAAPAAVRSLTLIEPVLFAAAHGSSVDDTLARDLAHGRADDAARRFLAVWGVQNYDELPESMQAKMRDGISLVADTNVTLSEDRADILRPDGLEAIDAPVLLIAGANSPAVIHEIVDAIAARLPDVGRARVPDAGHMLPVTHPQTVAELVGVNLDRA